MCWFTNEAKEHYSVESKQSTQLQLLREFCIKILSERSFVFPVEAEIPQESGDLHLIYTPESELPTVPDTAIATFTDNTA